MPRLPRESLEGALCHVIGRGNRGQSIFRDERDYGRFLDRLVGGLGKSDCKLYAYVLMPNHFHFLLEVGAQPLGRLMQPLLTSHAHYLNKRLGQGGHVFQDRYRAIICEREAHLLELVRYLHLNPVRAGLCQDPAEWGWSSHSLYLSGRNKAWLRAQEALRFFGDGGTGLRAYRRFMEDGIAMGHRAEFYPRPGAAQRGARSAGARPKRHESEKVLRRLCDALGGDWRQVTSQSRVREMQALRAVLVYFGVGHLHLSGQELAALFSRHPSAITRAAQQGEALVAKDSQMRDVLLSLTSNNAI